MPTATLPSAASALTTTIEGVELLAIGTWDASTGKARITRADLAAIVEAGSDPLSDAAPVKIGHDDDRFQDADGNPPSTRDGEPAYGWVENLRLSPDGDKLIGDLVGVPVMLAEIMNTALRRRSVEVVRHDRVGKKTYQARLDALSLLGVQAPAVKGLADLRALFRDQLENRVVEHFSVEIRDDTPEVPQSTSGNPDRDPQTSDSMAGANKVRLTTALRRALDIPDGASEDDIKKALRKAGLSLSENGDLVEDTTEITPPPAAPPVPAPPVVTQTPVAPPAAAEAAPVPPVAPVATVTQLPDPATAETATAGQPVTAQAVAAAAGTLGLTVVDSMMFDQLKADAAAGRAARDEQDKVRRDGLIRAAVAKGKIPTVAFKAYREMADKDESGTITLLAALPENERLATAPLGHGNAEQYSESGDPSGAADAAAARRKAAWEHFGVPLPSTPTA